MKSPNGRIIVQKYGGSSVASVEALKRVAEKIVDTRKRGYSVVVVTSAMGNKTDELLELAREVSPHPSSRELDMLLSVGERIAMAVLSMAINDLGCEAISFTGSQSGIITDTSHTNAKIVEVRAQRITRALEEGKIVIVAGYQGVSLEKEITTLGRGGSDTTSIALAAALSAERCEIYSDVDGVYTADPRIVDDAKKLDRLSYEEMEDLSRFGAVVLKREAVEYARRHNIDISLMSTFKRGKGTVVGTDRATVHGRPVLGLSLETDLLCLFGAGESWMDRVAGEVFPTLRDNGFNLRAIQRMAVGGDESQPFTFIILGGEGLSDPTLAISCLEKDHPWIGEHIRRCGSVTVIIHESGHLEGVYAQARGVLNGEGYDLIGYNVDDRHCTFYLPPEVVRPALRLLHSRLVPA